MQIWYVSNRKISRKHILFLTNDVLKIGKKSAKETHGSASVLVKASLTCFSEMFNGNHEFSL